MPLKQPLARHGHSVAHRAAPRRPALVHRHSSPAWVEAESSDTFEKGMDLGLAGGHERPRLGRSRSASPHAGVRTRPCAREAYGPRVRRDAGHAALWGKVRLFCENILAIFATDLLARVASRIFSERAKGYACAAASQAAAAAGVSSPAAGAAQLS